MARYDKRKKAAVRWCHPSILAKNLPNNIANLIGSYIWETDAVRVFADFVPGREEWWNYWFEIWVFPPNFLPPRKAYSSPRQYITCVSAMQGGRDFLEAFKEKNPKI